jgi:hypothetical protein
VIAWKWRNATGEFLLYSGRSGEEKREYGIDLILSKTMRKSLIEWSAVSERLITAGLHTCLRKLTIVQCYALTNAVAIEEKEAFYGLLEATLHRVKQSDIVILLGDFSAKNGETGWVLRMLWADMAWGLETKMETCLLTCVWITIW